MTRRRRILIGSLHRDGFLARNGQLTHERCLMLNWRGLEDWCQPCQFLDDLGLRWAIGNRLRLAGLKLVGMEIGTGEYAPVHCVVERAHAPHERARLINQIRQRWAAERAAAPPPIKAVN